VSAIKRKFLNFLKTSFSPWVAGIEHWFISHTSVLPVCFRNVTSQVPHPVGMVVIRAQACCCVPDSNYIHIPTVAGEQDFFVYSKGGVGIVEFG